MNLAQAAASAALSAVGALCNSGTLTGYSGTQPATPETALSGNTALLAASYSATAFGAPSFSSPNEQATGSFTGTVSPSANGACTFMRCVESNGTSVVADFSVGQAWSASNAFAVGQYCTNGGNSYQCTTAGTSAASGGPSGTGTGISDGTVKWSYSGSGQTFDVLMGNVNVTTGTTVTFTQTLQMPAV